jgi:protease I
MQKSLEGLTVAIIVTDGFEEVELTEPRRALQSAGAQTQIVSPSRDKVKAWNQQNWGETYSVDVQIAQADPENYDALFLPGGVMNPDKLRRNEKVLSFVKRMCEKGKPIAAICHGPWTLIDAGLVKGRRVTSYSSIQTDLKNAGAHWVDEEVVVDRGIITSRQPSDISSFNRKMIEEFARRKQAVAV